MKNDLRKIEIQLVMMVTAVIIFFMSFLVSVILRRTTNATRDNISGLLAADAQQLELNINSYLNKVERVTTILFSDENCYLFNAADPSLDDYERIQHETAINEEIHRLSVMENFSDFFIVYPNDEMVGQASQITTGMFQDSSAYAFFSEETKDNQRGAAWLYHVQDNQDRLFYVKRLNQSALIVISFYGRELDTVFQYSEQLESMTILLSSQDDAILYSNDKEMTGKKLPQWIRGVVKSDDGTMAAVTDEYFISANRCINGWSVICTVPYDDMMSSTIRTNRYILIFTSAVGLILLLAVLATYQIISAPMNDIVSELSSQAATDELTGLLNKAAFRRKAVSMLETSRPGDYVFFAMLDMDHFKLVNDTLGHSKGDEVLAGMGRHLRAEFRDMDCVGRMGGDEFAVLFLAADADETVLKEMLERRMNRLKDSFEAEFNHPEYTNETISIGCYLAVADRYDFDELYRQADHALYESKRAGRARVTCVAGGSDETKQE